MSIYVCACRDGAATARKQSAKAFSNSGCYAEVHGAHIKHLFAPYDNEAEKKQNGES